jgi:predicted phosphodiesterase
VKKMNKKYQVFVSSTYEDLQEERREVMQALLKLDCIPVGMELFPAADENQETLIKKLIGDCDYFILILGGRYGSINSEGKGYIQMEYEYALEKGIPIISFIHKNPEKIESGKTEQIPELKKKMERFKELVKKKTCSFWTSPSNLGLEVSTSLYKLFQNNPRTGWLKADLLPAGDATEQNLKLKKEIESLGPTYSDLGYGIYKGEKHLLGDDDLVIAHISDLHIGTEFPFQLPDTGRNENERRRSIVEIFKNDLEKLKLIGRLDALIISGDLSNKAKMSEFINAMELLKDISKKIDLDLSKFIIIAGNHDAQWNPDKLNKVHPYTKINRDNFETFRELLGRPKGDLIELVTIRSKSSNRLLRILAIDSNLVESPYASGIGYVGPDILLEANAIMDQSDAEKVNAKSIYTWIIIHHHVFPVSSTPAKDAFEKKISVMANVTELLSFANNHKVEMILHGHGHQPCITVSRRWPMENNPGFASIISVGAGSFSGHNSIIAPFSKNHYFLIYRRPENTIIRSRTLGSGLAFDTHSDIIIPHQKT